MLGLGTGNLNDSMMEKLADHGNGNYAYLDSFEEARKVLVHELSGTLATIAKDVKIQVEFNPRQAAAYRLIGYENRLFRDEDFNDDRKDAGEIGAGHTVTALYEVVPYGERVDASTVSPLKYQQPSIRRTDFTRRTENSELLTLQLRYKEPAGDKSQLLSVGVADSPVSLARASENLRFASAVALFGMLLKDSKHTGTATYDTALELARGAQGADPQGYRREFINLIEAARRLEKQNRS